MIEFTLSRDALLKPLQLVAGVVEKRQTLPILANVLLNVEQNQLSLTCTDLEVEIVANIALSDPFIEGKITVPARKLLDIVKSLPEEACISLKESENKVTVSSNRSRFSLAPLQAKDFPNIEENESKYSFDIPQNIIKKVIDSTSFAMAHQDVRYYLNGMLLELSNHQIRTVTTDGHRLAMSTQAVTTIEMRERKQVIVPRKGILELNRLMEEEGALVELSLTDNHICAKTANYTFTSKLVDGKFPDYERVIPKGGNKEIISERKALKTILNRAAILSNEKYRGVKFLLTEGNLMVKANNPEQEEAEVNLELDYQGGELEVGFNVSYLLDVLNVCNGDQVRILLSDANSSALMNDFDDDSTLYVIMPMRL